MTDLDRAAEYAAAAEAWRAYCAKGSTRKDTAGEPLAVVLLAGLCEPLLYADRFTGDLMTDVLGCLTAIVRRIEADAKDGGGGGLFIHNGAIEGWRRRLDAVLPLRSYESAHRERLTGKVAGEKGSAP